MLCTHENLNRFALWCSKFLCRSHSMNHHRAGTCNITAVHSNATRVAKRHSSGRKQSESISTGRCAVRTEECRCRQLSVAGPLVLQRKREKVWAKLESLFISTWQKGISLLSLTLTHFHYTKHTGTDTDKWCNVKQSRGIKAARKKNKVMTLPGTLLTLWWTLISKNLIMDCKHFAMYCFRQ